MPAVEAARKPQPLGKQTLLGIAPVHIERPAAIEKPAPSEPIQSSPNVPGYAIAYTPKDPPSTPAVVIAPEAQSSPEHPAPENKRQFSQTVPSRVRSAPNASVAPLPPLPAPDDFNPYAPKKGKGKLIGWGMGAALLLLVSVLGVRTISSGTSESRAPASPVQASDVVRATTVGTAPPTPEPAAPAQTAEPITTPAKPAALEHAASAVAARPASQPAPATKAKAKAKAEPAAAAPRPVTRAPTPEPSPTPTRPASKGIIVRDAPF